MTIVSLPELWRLYASIYEGGRGGVYGPRLQSLARYLSPSNVDNIVVVGGSGV